MYVIRVCCILLVIIIVVDYFNKVFFFNCKFDIGKIVSFKNFIIVNFERRVNFFVMKSKIWNINYVF